MLDKMAMQEYYDVEEAADCGHSQSINPWPIGSSQYYMWNTGWQNMTYGPSRGNDDPDG